MGTRGNIVIIFNNKIIVLYNHWDSYPSGLGKELVDQIQQLLKIYDLETLRKMMDNLHIVDENIIPTDDEIDKLKKYSDTFVASQSLRDWYCLLRKCQGSLTKILESGYVLADKIDNIKDCTVSLMIEYVYEIDLDNDKFICNDVCVGSLTDINHDWIV